jgi:hypothetical protein
MKELLSKTISQEQFGFLALRQIHEAVGVAQEVFHTIKTKKIQDMVIKVDLSKAYDRVNWLYLRLLLMHVGFNLNFVKWDLSCVSTISFAILINGSTSDFFRPGRGLKQGCPLITLVVSSGG